MKKIIHLLELKDVSYEGNIFKFQKKLKDLTFFTIVLILCLTFFGSLTKANVLNKINVDEPWILLKDTLGIKIYYEVAKCDQPITPVSGNLVMETSHQTFKLKLVNSNELSKSFKFSKITKTDSSDEFKTIVIMQGVTTLESCNDAPKLILANGQDAYPVSITDFINDFKFSIN